MDDLYRLVHSKKRRTPASSRPHRVDGDGPTGPGTVVALAPRVGPVARAVAEGAPGRGRPDQPSLGPGAGNGPEPGRPLETTLGRTRAGRLPWGPVLPGPSRTPKPGDPSDDADRAAGGDARAGPVEGTGGRDPSPLRASSGALGRTEAALGTDLPGEPRFALRGKAPGRGRAVAELVGEGGGLPLG